MRISPIATILILLFPSVSLADGWTYNWLAPVDEISPQNVASPEILEDQLAQPRIRLGVTGFDDRKAAYASAGLAFSFGEIVLGRPRSILDTGPLPQGAPGVPLSLRPFAAEAALEETLSAGLRFSSTQGGASFGSSLHTLEESSSSIVALAGRYDLSSLGSVDNIAVYGGAESDGEERQFRLGTEMTRGRTTAGIGLAKTNESDGRTLSQIYLGVAVTESLSLGLSGLRDTDNLTNTSDTRIGLGASITSESGAQFQGGVDGLTSDDPSFGFSVGLQF